jgi:hypothetical protein
MPLRSLLAAISMSTALLASSVSSAATVQSTGTITSIVTYTEHTGGTFSFKISNQPAGCHGFWISASHPGFKTAVALIMQARATGEGVLVGADTSYLWTGSSNPWCRVDYVGTP